MVGIYGTTRERDTSELESGLENLGNEEKYSKNLEFLNVGLIKHPNSVSSYSQNNSKHCWVWGKIKGQYTEDREVYRQTEGDTAEILLDFYKNNDISEFDRLNGEFFAVIFDEEENTLKLVTDRLGSRVAFYTTEGKDITFSNDIQSLCRYSGKKELIEEYCIEYLAYKRVFGTKTPFKDVEKLPPASVTTFDLDTGELNHENYWRPKYDPEDKPYSYFVEKFTEIFQRVIAEEIEDDKSYGLMLSGGSDSRLIAGTIDQEITCYHANEWMNTEAKIAEKVAKTADHKFEFLERDEDYQPRALKENTELSKFVSNFNQAHFYGFREKLGRGKNVLINGLFADTIFKGSSMKKKSVNLGLGNLVLPLEEKIEEIHEYIQTKPEIPNYLKTELNKEDIYRNNLVIDGEINNHDIKYENLNQMIYAEKYYPFSNRKAYLTYDSLLQNSPTITPFIDSRFINLYLRTPKKYLIQRNIINSATEQISPKLAKIKKSDSKLPAKYPELLHFTSNKMQEVGQKYLPTEEKETPEPHYNNGSWTDHTEVLREKDFALESIENNKDLIEELSFLNYSSCKNLMQEHRQGEYKTNEIYRLVTFLETLNKIRS